VAQAAANHVHAKGASILANEKFTALRDRLGNGAAATSVSFLDLPATSLATASTTGSVR
jgi:hypothetical protein